MNSYIHERQTIPNLIKKTESFENCKELTLNHNFIDPSKMSPPNSFMEKLIKRMDNYYSPSNKNINDKCLSFKNYS
jgi:hypothetical protein